MKQFQVITACAALCAVAVATSISPVNAGQKGACQALPVGTVSAALNAQLQAHETQAPSPNGGKSFTCYYAGRDKQATLMVYYESSSAMAAADRAGWDRMAAMSGGAGGTGMTVTKGNVALSLFVRQPTSKATLRGLLAAAERNL